MKKLIFLLFLISSFASAQTITFDSTHVFYSDSITLLPNPNYTLIPWNGESVYFSKSLLPLVTEYGQSDLRLSLSSENVISYIEKRLKEVQIKNEVDIIRYMKENGIKKIKIKTKSK